MCVHVCMRMYIHCPPDLTSIYFYTYVCTTLNTKSCADRDRPGAGRAGWSVEVSLQLYTCFFLTYFFSAVGDRPGAGRAGWSTA